MEQLFRSFGRYIKTADLSSIEFWAYPIGTILLIWLLTIISLKFKSKKKIIKTVFRIYKTWICTSLLIATVIIGLICYRWAGNYFSDNPTELSMLLSLFLALLISVISFAILRNFFTIDNLKEIAEHPKTTLQLDTTVEYTKKVYRNKKICLLLLLAGFLFLLFSLNKGQNLIAIVFDNSGSMENSGAIEAISETFEKLETNNEIILTTLDGVDELFGGKNTLQEILKVTRSQDLKAGNIVSFPNPESAKEGLNQLNNDCWGSPICESIWKTFLFIYETKRDINFKQKMLIIITDGIDDVSSSISSGNFFFDNKDFLEFFPSENVFIIDYSSDNSNAFLDRFENEGANVFPVSNSKDDYFDALDYALQAFKNNWFLIYWVIIFVVIMSFIILLIKPKKII